jgi:hypothetical protein
VNAICARAHGTGSTAASTTVPPNITITSTSRVSRSPRPPHGELVVDLYTTHDHGESAQRDQRPDRGDEPRDNQEIQDRPHNPTHDRLLAIRSRSLQITVFISSSLDPGHLAQLRG